MTDWFQKETVQRVGRVILVTNKNDTPPLLKALAIEFRNRVLVGVILGSADDEAKSQLTVQKTPAVLRVDNPSAFGSEKLKAKVFKGDLKKGSLIDFFIDAVDFARKGSPRKTGVSRPDAKKLVADEQTQTTTEKPKAAHFEF